MPSSLQATGIGVLLFALLALAQGSAIHPEPARDTPLDTLTSDAPEAPAIQRVWLGQAGEPLTLDEWVPVRVVVDPGPGAGSAQLHLTVRGPDGVDELEPEPLPTRGSPALLVAFWEPQTPGTYTLDGHVHVAGEQLEIPQRQAEVQPAADASSPDGTDGTDGTGSLGIAPGTVLWALVFMGLAFAAQRRKRRGGGP